MKPIFVAVLLVAFAPSALAGPVGKSEQLSKELAELTGTKAMFAAYLQQCVAPNSGYDPNSFFKSNPSYFGGISPKSAYWPEIEALFREYQRQMCNYITPEDFSTYYASYYKKALTENELKASVAFFTTPTGSKFSAANQGANAEFQKYAQEKMSELYKSAYAELNAKLAGIVQKYQKAPK
jgi:hypothetical protein